MRMVFLLDKVIINFDALFVLGKIKLRFLLNGFMILNWSIMESGGS